MTRRCASGWVKLDRSPRQAVKSTRQQLHVKGVDVVVSDRDQNSVKGKSRLRTVTIRSPRPPELVVKDMPTFTPHRPTQGGAAGGTPQADLSHRSRGGASSRPHPAHAPGQHATCTRCVRAHPRSSRRDAHAQRTDPRHTDTHRHTDAPSQRTHGRTVCRRRRLDTRLRCTRHRHRRHRTSRLRRCHHRRRGHARRSHTTIPPRAAITVEHAGQLVDGCANGELSAGPPTAAGHRAGR